MFFLMLFFTLVIVPFFSTVIQNNGKIILRSSEEHFAGRIRCYLIIALFGIAVTTYLKMTSSIFWVFNIVGLVLLFGKYIFRVRIKMFMYIVLYIFSCGITILLNSTFFSTNLKAIGTNVNIIAAIIMAAFIDAICKKKSLDEKEMEKILLGISYFGIITVAFTWYYAFGDIVNVFRGMNPYAANVSGFFHGKNPYGAFVSLTLCPDLYFFYGKNQHNKKTHLIVLTVKLLAVLLSFSRAALLQAGITVLVFLWLNRKKRGLEQLFIILGGIALIVVFIGSDRIQNFIFRSVLRLNAGDAGRADIRSNTLLAVSDISKMKLLLFGVGNFGIVSLGLDLDNTYLYLFFSGGCIKLLFFAGIVYFSFRKIRELMRKNKLLGTLCLAVAISYYIYAFYESVALLELGILHFLFTLYLICIPAGYYECKGEQFDKASVQW